MKTAISIPDETFRKAERVAKKLGLSRSELYAMAVRSFVEPLLSDEITKALDDIYAVEPSGLNHSILELQARSLPGNTW